MMIDRCTRCHRRLTGLFSTQVGMGPVCMRKIHRAKEEAVAASKAQGDLFSVDLAMATMSTRVQSLLARVQALEGRKLNHADLLQTTRPT